MNKTDKLNGIMLIDDNPDDNFYHQIIIEKFNPAIHIISMESATEALEYLTNNKEKSKHLNLIFLDVNMPGMNGWDFLEAYSKLDISLQSNLIIIMLTTSDNTCDIEKAKKWNFVSEFKTKPVTKKLLEDITEKYFETKTEEIIK